MNTLRGGGDPLHILMVCARFPPLTGGTEVHVAEVSKRLANRGHVVTVLTTVLNGDDVGTEIVDGVTVERVRAWPSRSDVYFAPRVRRWVRSFDGDLVHIQGYHTLVAPFAMSGARRAGLPFVMSFHSGGHDSAVRRSLRPIQWRVLRPQLRRAQKLVGVSEFETRFFAETMRLPADRFETITNGVNEAFLNQERPAQTGPVISSIGRLAEYKGHQHVIDALPAVRQRVPGAVVRMIGSGPYLPELRRRAQTAGVEEHVEFVEVPYQNRAAMAHWMAQSAVIAVLSSYESQGIVGLEALATGAPLVVSDGSALADLTEFGGVEVVSPTDRDALVDALVRQLETNGSVDGRRLPTWEDTTDRVERMYRRALEA